MTSCSELMTRNPASCLPSDSAFDAAKLMKQQDIGPIPVVESRESNRLVGIITDRDLTLRVLAERRDPETTKVGEIMSRNPAVCNQAENVQTALNTMSSRQVRRIPVINDQRGLVGIISQADIATRMGAPRKIAAVVQRVSTAPGAAVEQRLFGGSGHVLNAPGPSMMKGRKE
ncbi:MAG TPA: CBS domain-containing protein [Terriglobia bacterium]|nr:CBS domain-containing protein [Terriglobia bacterium]